MLPLQEEKKKTKKSKAETHTKDTKSHVCCFRLIFLFLFVITLRR
jgi:hypothetical protein